MTDDQIDRMLAAPIPGGSQARDWFLPHETPQGLRNVRTVVRAMLAAAAPTIPEGPGVTVPTRGCIDCASANSDGFPAQGVCASCAPQTSGRGTFWSPLNPPGVSR